MKLALLDLVAAQSPIECNIQPAIEGRVLHIDGDGLAYLAGGNERMSIPVSRGIVYAKVRKWKEQARATHAVMHLTASGTLKGDRVLVPTAKPYQAHRTGAKKPQNWQYLRDWFASMLDNPVPDFEVKAWADREADDAFGWASTSSNHQDVICTADKDMQMIPGWHLNWTTGSLFFVDKTTYRVKHEGKLYGYGWFHHQLLQGDTADGIRGIGCFGLAPRGCGTATAKKLLKHVDNALDGNRRVTELYKQAFPEDWAWELCTQASLLWIRRTRNAALWEFIPYLTRGLSSEDNWAMRVAMRDIIGHVNRRKEEAKCLQNLHTPD